MFLKYLTTAIIILALSIPASADQVTLLNGDRISGVITRLEGGKLGLNSDMAGAILLPWQNVRSIFSTQPLYVMLKGGKIYNGAIVNSDKGLRIEDSNGSLDVPKADVVAMRSYSEQALWQVAEERRQAPHFLDPWTGFTDIGFSLARGNTDVTTYSLNTNLVRTKPKDKLTLNFTALYSHNTATEPMAITANVRRGGARYEMNLNPRQFAFVSADFEFDQLQKLDLRAVGGFGFGQHVLKSQRNVFDLFAGGTINREEFEGSPHRLTSEALISEESSHKLTRFLTIRQKMAMFPNINEGGEYRMAFDSSAVTNLLRWLSWQISVSDRYISNPPAGAQPNDLLLTTGFRFNLLPHR